MSDPKIGIRFQNGIPGRPNSAGHPGLLSQIGYSASGHSRYSSPRGAGRGTGSTRDGRGMGRGGNQNGYPSPAPNSGYPVAARIQQVDESCSICDRPKTEVFCQACGWAGRNMRVKKVCPTHPKLSFVQDLESCPECKMENLEEEVA